MTYNMKDLNIYCKKQLPKPHENEYMRGYIIAFMLALENGKCGKRTLYHAFHCYDSYRPYIRHRYYPYDYLHLATV